MNSIVINFEKIKALINNSNVKVIAVSKSFNYDYIKPLVHYGHRHFGENKVQEAIIKWSNVKDQIAIPSGPQRTTGKLQTTAPATQGYREIVP